MKNPRRKRPIFVMENIFVGKYGIQSTNEMAFKRTVPLREFSTSDLMRACYCRSADERMRMQNALLFLGRGEGRPLRSLVQGLGNSMENRRFRCIKYYIWL